MAIGNLPTKRDICVRYGARLFQRHEVGWHTVRCDLARDVRHATEALNYGILWLNVR